MEDSGQRANNRLLMAGAFAGGIVIAVIVVIAIGILFFDIGPWGEAQETRSTSRESRSTTTEEEPEVEEAIPEGVQLVGILPAPRIAHLGGPGESLQLEVQGYYSDDSVAGLPTDSRDRLEFTSDDSEVVRVTSNGELTGAEIGGSNVTVTFGKFSSTVPVLVWGPARSVPAADPAQLLEIDSEGSAVILNRIIVELNDGFDVDDGREIAAVIGGEVIFEFSTFPGFLIELEPSAARDLEQPFDALDSDQRVARAYPDLIVPSSQASVLETIETLRIDPSYGTAYLQAGMHEAWEKMSSVGPANSEPVVIAVIDSGFAQPQNESIAIQEVLEREFDYDRVAIVDGIVGDNPNARHGTSVTSVMVAQNNPDDIDTPGESFSGVVSSVDGLEYHLIFYEVGEGQNGGQSVSGIINALEEITAFQSVIDVVNFSTSVVCSDFDIDSLVGSGSLSSHDRCGWVGRWAGLMTGMPWVTFVTSAGNANRDIDATDREYRVIPAAFSIDLQNTITAGGLWGATPRGQSAGWVYDRADISNYGEAITVGALHEVWALDVDDSDGYSYKIGTSFSAPMVTGVVALLKALDPDISPAQIKQILPDSGSLVRVCNSFRSHPDDPCPEEEKEWRSLNAGKAVTELLRRSVKANIDLTRATNPKNADLNTAVNLRIPVKNVG